MKYTNSNQWYQEYGKEVMDENEFSEFEKYLNDRSKDGSHTLDEWEDLYADFLKDSKKSARKSIKEAKVMSYDEFKKIVKKEFTKDEIEGFGKTDNGYGVYVIAYGEKEIEIMCDDLRQYGFECKWWHSSDPEDDEPIYFIEAIPIMNESKKSARKSINESRGQTVAELLQNASSKTIVHIYNDSTSDEFVGTNDQLKGEFSRFLYYTVSVWNIGNDKIANIYCY